jgi:hypothetical protein
LLPPFASVRAADLHERAPDLYDETGLPVWQVGAVEAEAILIPAMSGSIWSIIPQGTGEIAFLRLGAWEWRALAGEEGLLIQARDSETDGAGWTSITADQLELRADASDAGWQVRFGETTLTVSTEGLPHINGEPEQQVTVAWSPLAAPADDAEEPVPQAAGSGPPADDMPATRPDPATATYEDLLAFDPCELPGHAWLKAIYADRQRRGENNTVVLLTAPGFDPAIEEARLTAREALRAQAITANPQP